MASLNFEGSSAHSDLIQCTLLNGMLMNRRLQFLSGYWKCGACIEVTFAGSILCLQESCYIFYLVGMCPYGLDVPVASTNWLLDSPCGHVILGCSLGLYLSIVILDLHSLPLYTPSVGSWMCGWWRYWLVASPFQTLGYFQTVGLCMNPLVHQPKTCPLEIGFWLTGEDEPLPSKPNFKMSKKFQKTFRCSYNILYSYKKMRGEETFCAAGVKRKIPGFQNASARNFFLLFFIPATQNVFSIRNIFAWLDIFHMNIRNFC